MGGAANQGSDSSVVVSLDIRHRHASILCVAELSGFLTPLFVAIAAAIRYGGATHQKMS